MTSPRPPAAEPSKPTVAIGGIAVLLVVVQGTSTVPVELLGPDLLLAVGGFVVTTTVVAAADADGALRLRTWYGDQLRLRAPLLVGTAALVMAVAAAVYPPPRATALGDDAVAWTAGVGNWWELVSALPSWAPLLERAGVGRDWFVETPSPVDPLGTAWLVGLLVQLVLVWPLVLAPVRRAVGAHRHPRRLVPALLVLFVAAAAVGPLRAVAGAVTPELALGTHVRLAEWVAGASAAAWVAARPAVAGSRRAGNLLTTLAAALLLGSALSATIRPEEWLRAGGPVYAAVGAAVLLLAVHAHPDGAPARALGRGLPLELGRSAYPLLLLHLPIFWLLQLVIPGARPFALLVVGAALAWLLGLVLQEGIVRRVVDRRSAIAAAVGLLALGVVAGGTVLHRAAQGPVGTGPVVLVAGGARASDLAHLLAATGRVTVVDASRPGCGLLPAAAPATGTRTGTRGQLPLAPPPLCGDGIERARADVVGSVPAAVVVDLAADAGRAGSPGPCDPAFRTRYRALLAEAAGIWTAGAPAGPVLVVDGPPGSRAGRCLDALLAEAVVDHGALVPLPIQASLCPFGPSTCDGTVAGLDAARRAALGRTIGDAVAAELTPARVRAREGELRADCAGRDDAAAARAGC